MRDFVAEFKQRVKHIDASEAEFLIPKDAVIPEDVTQPEGPLYAIYKRSIAAKNNPVFMSLTLDEATKRCNALNQKAIKDRREKEEFAHKRGLEYQPDAVDLIFYDMVEQGTEQENVFWNPQQVIRGQTE